MRRIDANREIYEQWPIEIRQAVLDGKVEEGMTPDMVTLAIGKPTEVVTRSGATNSGDDEVWIYRTGGVDTDPGMMYPGAAYPGGMYPSGVYPSSTGGGIVMSPGRGGGVAVIPPTVGIGGRIGGAGIGTGIGTGIGGVGAGMPMPVQTTPVEEREVVFRNGVVYRADPPPETK